MFDLIIKNGMVYDGSGSLPKKTDIAINSDKISQIGDLQDAKAKEIIDAENLAISPGFIDTHSHADFDILRNPQHIYGISQGVTTEILSPDGIGIVPLSKNKSAEHINYLSGILGYPPEDFDGTSFDQAKNFYHKKSKCNVAVFAGHGPLRLELCGMDDVPLRGEKMKKLLITGGAGFIGSNLIKELLKKDYEIVSLDNFSTGNRNNELDGVKYINTDITNMTFASKTQPILNLICFITVL